MTFLNGSSCFIDILYGEGGRNFLIGTSNDNFVITLPGSLGLITDFGVGGNDMVTIQQSGLETAANRPFNLI